MQVADRFFGIARPGLEIDEFPADLREEKLVWFLDVAVLFAPAGEGSFDKVARAVYIVLVLEVSAAEFEKDFVTVRVVLQSDAEELFGFFHFTHLFSKPERANYIILHSIWVEIRGEF